MTDQMEGIASYGREMARLAAQTRDIRRFTKLARKIQVMADGEISRLQEEAAKDGIKPACGKGCSSCCHRLVVATAPEVISALVHMMETASSQEREDFLARVDRSEAANRGFWEYQKTRAMAPCPFLVEDACSIYDLRPLTCRALNSDDPEKCRPRESEEDELPPSDIPKQSQISHIAAQLVAACREAGVISGGYEFGLTVATLLRNPSLLNGLNPMVPELEKLKLVSEYAVADETVLPELAIALANPVRSEVNSLLHRGYVDKALELLPQQDSEAFSIVSSHAMPPFHMTEADIDASWEHWGQALDRFENSNLNPGEVFGYLQPFNTFSVAYSGRDVRPYLERYMRVAHRYAARALPHLCAPIEAPRRPGKFRLGYISYRIKNFNGSRWSIGWLKNHSKDIETYVINLTEQEDGTSLVFRRMADNYFHVPLTVSTVAAFVRELDLDALIFTDVGMCGHTTQLSLLRLARRQFGAWGHPVTSGSPMMDYYLSSDMMEPENGQDHYTEKLLRLPGSGLTYVRRQLMPSLKSASDFGLPEDGFIFCGQNPLKLLPKHDFLWAEIAARTSKPLVFLEGWYSNDLNFLRRRIEALGIPAVFLPSQTREDYLRLLQLAEVSVDPPAWNGGNTTIEAVTLGTPVVSMSGEFMRGRHALAFLNQAGVGDLIARTPEDYIDLVVNSDRRNSIFQNARPEAIYDDLHPVREIDRLLLEG